MFPQSKRKNIPEQRLLGYIRNYLNTTLIENVEIVICVLYKKYAILQLFQMFKIKRFKIKNNTNFGLNEIIG